MSETLKSFTLGQLHVCLDVDTYEPSFNWGRETSFGAPLVAMTPHLAGGYNLSEASAVSYISIETYAAIKGVTVDDVIQEIKDQRQAYLDALCDKESTLYRKAFNGAKDKIVFKTVEFNESGEKVEQKHEFPIDEFIARYKSEVVDCPVSKTKTVIVISAQRRTECWPMASWYRERILGLEMPLTYYGVESKAKTLKDVQVQQARDNADSTKSSYDFLGKLSQAVDLLDQDTYTDAEIGKVLDLWVTDKGKQTKPNTRAIQTVCRAAKLIRIARRYDMDLLTRFRMTPKTENKRYVYSEGGYVPIHKADKEDLAYLIGVKKSPNDTDDIVATVFDGTYPQLDEFGEPMPANAEQLESYFKMLCAGKKATAQQVTTSQRKEITTGLDGEYWVELKACLHNYGKGNTSWFSTSNLKTHAVNGNDLKAFFTLQTAMQEAKIDFATLLEFVQSESK